MIRTPRKTIFQILLSAAGSLFLLLASGCYPIAATPEEAATYSALHQNRQNFQVDPNTLQVLQSTEVNQSTLVLIAYQGKDTRFGSQSCLDVYEIRKGFLGGYRMFSSGSGCTSEGSDQPMEPLTYGSNTSGGNQPKDTGYSCVNGQIFQDKIQHVLVTWDDGVQQEATLQNDSFLAARSGNHDLKKIEALDASDQLIYRTEPAVAPEKQQTEENNGNR
jgi:hypothetical protein